MKYIKPLTNLILLYLIHELGHVMMYIIFGIPFTTLIFPQAIGIPHFIGFTRPFTNDIIKEFLIKIIGPLLLKGLYVLFILKDKRYFIAYSFSYGDIIIFSKYWLF